MIGKIGGFAIGAYYGYDISLQRKQYEFATDLWLRHVTKGVEYGIVGAVIGHFVVDR